MFIDHKVWSPSYRVICRVVGASNPFVFSFLDRKAFDSAVEQMSANTDCAEMVVEYSYRRLSDEKA